MYRTFVIVRHTFFEAIVQPIYTLLIALAAAILLVFSLLPFFTFDEDTVMFMSVGLDVILLFVLIATLFATSRSIFEEIEDRTMLTLMSKPVRKWEVMAGKYVGIILAALMAVAILGAVLCLCTWMRIPGDYRINARSLDDRELTELAGFRRMHLAGLLPSLALIWLEISTLAAVGVALSTRVPLVVNLPVVILIYFAGNMTRFLSPMSGPGAVLEGRSAAVKGLAWLTRKTLPSLDLFDLRALTIHRKIALAQFAGDPNATPLATIWSFMAGSSAYAVLYVVFALAAGMFLFQRRELGGSEG